MGFIFSDKNIVEIDIEGKTYKLDPYGNAILDGMAEYNKSLRELKADDASSSNVKETCKLVEKLINSILGKDSYKKIFAGREPNLLDHLELVAYIMTKVAEFRAERIKDMVGTEPDNSNNILTTPPVQ